MEVKVSNYEVDFDDVVAQVSFEQAIELLKLDMRKEGVSFRCACPAHEGSSPRSLAYTPGKGWYCQHDKLGGKTVIGLSAHTQFYGETDQRIAMKKAAMHLLGKTSKEKEKSPTTPVTVAKPSEGFKLLSYLEYDHMSLAISGIETSDAERFGIGVAPRGDAKGWILIPVYDTTTKLCAGYVGVPEIAWMPKAWRA